MFWFFCKVTTHNNQAYSRLEIEMMSSSDGLNYLSDYINWHTDGTFYTAEKC